MAKRKKSWYSMQASASGESAEIFIYDEIGIWGIDAKRFVQDLNDLDVSHIDLRINSPGGSVFEGNAIYNALKRHPAEITSHIDSLAASMASVIALAGNAVNMAANGLYMIHEVAGGVWGTSSEMRKTADLIDKLAMSIVNAYADKTGMDTKEIEQAMQDETWYSAQEALDAGFIDNITEELQIAACFDLDRYGYRNMPQCLPFKAVAEEPDPESPPDSLIARQIKLNHLERSLRY